MILYGPPGTGKTTLARMLAEYADAAFEELSRGRRSGRAEVREVMARARERRRAGRAHDLLPRRDPPLQQGPAGRAAARGRGRARGAGRRDDREPVLRGQLGADLAHAGLRAARADRRRTSAGCCGGRWTSSARRVSDEVIEFLAARSGGDARSVAERARAGAATRRRARASAVTLADAEDAMQRKALRYDKAGDQHYDYISAWIKSTRGSDPDASLYYLAAMLEGGEDARFIARRMVDPGLRGRRQRRPAGAAGRGRRGRTRSSTSACRSARSRSPRRRSTSSLAPKSNAAGKALGAARAHIREHGAALPPAALRSAAYPAARRSAAGAATTTRTTTPGTSTTRSTCPQGAEDRPVLRPAATASRSCASG